MLYFFFLQTNLIPTKRFANKVVVFSRKCIFVTQSCLTIVDNKMIKRCNEYKYICNERIDLILI